MPRSRPFAALPPLLLLVALLPVAGGAGGGCRGALDCSLNGACVGGACACDKGWTGSSCGVLDLEPAVAGEGLGGLQSNFSSWGNSVRRWPTTGPRPGDGRWYMAADVMDRGCGMSSYGQNSRCVMASSPNAAGPYSVVGGVMDAFCHGSSLGRDPLSGRWIHGHLGSGDGTSCIQCSGGVTPPKPYRRGPCTNTTALRTPSALIADSPLGPWTPAPELINAPNAEPLFLRNGTLFYVSPWQNLSSGDAGCDNQLAFLSLSRAESLDDALAGRWTYKNAAPTLRLAGSNESSPCVNWEGNNLWVDRRGHFHTLAHAWRAQPTDYPLPGCGSGPPYNAKTARHPSLARPGESCTSLGGHAFSLDGRVWYVSPIAPYNNTVRYASGQTLVVRARERPHLVFDDEGQPSFLANALGAPGAAGGSGGGNGGVPGADHAFVQHIKLRGV